MLAWIMSAVLSLVIVSGIHHMPAQGTETAQHTADTASMEAEWHEYHTLAYAEYSDEFTALFNGYETKWAKNGRLMMRTGDTGPYKFVKRGI